MWKRTDEIVARQPTFCGYCHIIVAPYAEQIRFLGKTFHENNAQRCFTKWRLAELAKQAEKRRSR